MKSIPEAFYNRKDVVLIARELIGKLILTRAGKQVTLGRIVETEAYIGLTDRASHSFGGKRTMRNEHMYAGPGTSYVYICYGLHPMFNLVTNQVNIPDAVLIRALEPLEGITVMSKRTGKDPGDPALTRGPGNLCRAMGIDKSHSGLYLPEHPRIQVLEDGYIPHAESIGISPRIGMRTAGEDTLNPFRFYVRGNRFVSGSPVR